MVCLPAVHILDLTSAGTIASLDRLTTRGCGLAIRVTLNVEMGRAAVPSASQGASGDPREFIPVIVWGVVDRVTGRVLEAYVDVHEGIAEENFEERARELGIELDAVGEPRPDQARTMFWRSSELGRSEHLLDEADDLAAAVADLVKDHISRVPTGGQMTRVWERVASALNAYRERWGAS
jgi:hypothetical protein